MNRRLPSFSICYKSGEFSLDNPLPTVLVLNFRDFLSEAQFTARLFNVYNWEVGVRDKTKGSDAWMDPDGVVVDGRRDFGDILKKIRYKVIVVSFPFCHFLVGYAGCLLMRR